MKRKSKLFWMYLILLILIYVGLFFFIRNKLDISGSFAFDTEEPVYLTDVPDIIRLNVGEPFFLDINYEEGYVFADNADLFDIGRETGEISFIPEDSGTYPVVIIAFHDITNYEVKLVKFVVEP